MGRCDGSAQLIAGSSAKFPVDTMRAEGYTLRPMNDSVHATSGLREWRNRIGISTRDLARMSGVSATTVRNAERGRVSDETIRQRINDGLERALQRAVYAAKDDARAAVVRAEIELEATRARADEIDQQQDALVQQLRESTDELWTGFDTEAEDEAETPVAA